MRSVRRTSPGFAPGDRVLVVFPSMDVPATVIEDLGPIGVGGRHILQVQTDDPAEGQPFDVVEDNLRPFKKAS